MGEKLDCLGEWDPFPLSEQESKGTHHRGFPDPGTSHGLSWFSEP